MPNDLNFSADPTTGRISSITLYGNELLDTKNPAASELLVNGQPWKLRPHPIPGPPGQPADMSGEGRFKGERFVNHFAGAALVLNRSIGLRSYGKFPCVGVHHSVRRESADMTDLPCPGPGGPVMETPLWIDTITPMAWNWNFWGDDTLMLHTSFHSNGPIDEFGHCGLEHDTPENAKRFMQNLFRRTYPSSMAIHGAVYYNKKTNHWITITCRRPNVGYILNITDAGRGVNYDYTFHKLWQPNDYALLPEVKIHYGDNRESMMQWIADYITHYYQQPPEWLFKTVFGHGLAWNNKPTWTQQADHWEKLLDEKTFNGVNYSLVTNRPVKSGTSPLGYEPDSNHGTIDEFKAMCLRLKKRDVPLFIWMSHSGMLAGAPDIDDDWFIRGIDGKMSGAWGFEHAAMAHINPGHPGYIEYTKKWVRFYLVECGAKGIFFDCLGWCFPPDFVPRKFMRFPGDVGVMSIRFMDEIYAYMKECDPESVMLGEGWSSDGPVNIFSLHANPTRGVDTLGPRGFALSLNKWSQKRIVVDQGPEFAPGSGFTRIDSGPDAGARNRAMVELLKTRGGPRAFTPLPGDLSLLGDLLIVPATHDHKPQSFTLPGVVRLENTIDGGTIHAAKPGEFEGVNTGIYRVINA